MTDPLAAAVPIPLPRRIVDSVQSASPSTPSTDDEAFQDHFRYPDFDDLCGGELAEARRALGHLTRLVTDLRLERYVRGTCTRSERLASLRAVRRGYYFMRPLLPVSVRKHLQRMRLNGWRNIPFPHWPVDFTVEALMEHAMGLLLTNLGLREIPFIWFWPDGAPSCVMVTHDVEGPAGRDFCERLMDLDEEYGVRSAFGIIPESRYPDADRLVARVRERGFEPNVHDLNHDGRLFDNKADFLRRAARINEYARRFQTRGFRAGGMYRNQEWFAALEISYEMSVPNVAHLDPQRGGCCTVMPYFVSDVLELPLTTTQDYSLFNILGDYSTTLWAQQVEMIMARNGLISFNTHPDYLIDHRALAVYRQLLEHLAPLRDGGRVWLAVPGEVEQWWRNRQNMRLLADGNSWRIEGADSERARLGYATLEDDRVVYRLAS